VGAVAANGVRVCRGWVGDFSGSADGIVAGDVARVGLAGAGVGVDAAVVSDCAELRGVGGCGADAAGSVVGGGIGVSSGRGGGDGGGGVGGVVAAREGGAEWDWGVWAARVAGGDVRGVAAGVFMDVLGVSETDICVWAVRYYCAGGRDCVDGGGPEPGAGEVDGARRSLGGRNAGGSGNGDLRMAGDDWAAAVAGGGAGASLCDAGGVDAVALAGGG